METIAVLRIRCFVDDEEALPSMEMALYGGVCWEVANPMGLGPALVALVLHLLYFPRSSNSSRHSPYLMLQ